MPKKESSQDFSNQNPHLNARIDELEIKVSFLEKELGEYKEANREFYGKLIRLESDLKKLQKEIPGSGQPVPEPSWDRENRDIHP